MTNFPPLHASFSVFCSPFLSLYLLCFLHSESPLSVLSPLLCSRGLYFTVPWVLLSDSTADPEAARKSYSALYQMLCCLVLAIRRVLTPGSLMTTISPVVLHHRPHTTHATHQWRTSLHSVCMCSGTWEYIVLHIHRHLCHHTISYKMSRIRICYLWHRCVRRESQHSFLPEYTHVCIIYFFIHASVSSGSGSKTGEMQWS